MSLRSVNTLAHNLSLIIELNHKENFAGLAMPVLNFVEQEVDTLFSV